MVHSPGRTVNPSEIAPVAKKAILSAADGSLALKQDAALPGASQKCLVYKTHDLEWRLAYPKRTRVEGKLECISSEELLAMTMNRNGPLLAKRDQSGSV